MATAKADKAPPRPIKLDPECTRCSLHTRSRIVCCPGSGPLDAGIWLFGEALGANEEQLGKPFVGDAGHKLNYLLARSGIRRKRCRIENICRCRPPGNTKPSAKHVAACWGYSLYLILKHKPKVIVAMGATAINALMEPRGGKGKGKGRKVDSWRGFYERRTFTWTSPKTGQTTEHTCWVVPTFHPSFCLRKWEADDLFVFDILTAIELVEGREPQSWPDTKVTVLKTKDEAVEFLRHLRRVSGFVVDVEDTNLQVHQSVVMCLGFCYKAGHATILPLHLQGDPPLPMWRREEYLEILEELTATLESTRLYGQNIKYDLQRLRRLTGIVDYKVGFDTMLAHHVLDENKPHNLTFLCQWYLGWQKYDAVLEPYKEGKSLRMWLVPDQTRHIYCGFDVDGTFRLRKVLKPMLVKDKVERAYRIEHDLTLPLADMEYRGIRLSRRRIQELSDLYRRETALALRKLTKIADRVLGVSDFNPNSTKQLVVLLEHCGADLWKKTKGGKAPAVDRNVMAALALTKGKAGGVARGMIQLRKVAKYVNTYLDGKDSAGEGKGGFLRWVQEEDRIHPNYNIAIARTGRLSADDPPIQQMPRTGDLRSILIPDAEDHVLLTSDYQKVELCVAAWLANDEVMVRELLAGVDLHSKMAITARMMRNPTEEEWETYLALEKALKAGPVSLGKLTPRQSKFLRVIGVAPVVDLVGPIITKDERAVAKGVNFGVTYGRGAAGIAEANPHVFPPAMKPRDRRARVQKVIDAFFDKYQGIALYREEVIENLHKRGFIRTTITGRVRRLYGLNWLESKYSRDYGKQEADLSHMEREALNSEIQSEGSADPLSQATKRVWDGMKKVRLPGFRMLLTLHDGMIFNVHRQHVEEAEHWVRQWMETTLKPDGRHKFEMPLRIDTTIERWWGEHD